MKRLPGIARRLLPALLLLGLAACGFQPRGGVTPLAGDISPLQITGIHAYSDLHKALARRLRERGVTVTRDDSAASARLVILAHATDDYVLSVDAQNKLLEVELRQTVRFRLDSGGRERVAEQSVSLLRIHYTPKEEVLGSNNERDLILGQMHEELATRIVQRLARQL
jgi:outer membrane lipopolysaccharide assembly protein LptE/RlpB